MCWMEDERREWEREKESKVRRENGKERSQGLDEL